MNDSKDNKMISNQRRIYLFVCTIPDCNDICLNRDKLLDHLAGHKLFETKVFDFANYDNGEEQLAEFIKMIDNDENNGETSNTARKRRLKTRNNSKKMQCIFSNCESTFVDRKDAIVHLQKQHFTILDILENNLLQIYTKNVDEIVDKPKSDSKHSDMAVDHVKIELLSDTDIDDDNNGSDNQDDDQTLTPPDVQEDLVEEISNNNKMVKPESSPKKRKRNKRSRGNYEHLFVHLSDDANKNRPFQCLKCDKSYPCRDKVLRHIANVHDQQRSHCQFEGCSASYSLPSALRHHVSIVHTKDAVLIRCPWSGCDYSSYHRHFIVRHRRVHTGERPFRCEWPDCQKAFKTTTALSMHTASHRNERLHRCSWPGCSNSFNIAASLKKHFELHKQGRLKEKSKVAMDSQDRPESSTTDATALLKTLQ